MSGIDNKIQYFVNILYSMQIIITKFMKRNNGNSYYSSN